jgi:hypothetical protein
MSGQSLKFQYPMVVEPGYPFQGRQFDGFTSLPCSESMDQGIAALGLPVVQRLFQRVEREVGPNRTAHAPARDTAGKNGPE